MCPLVSGAILNSLWMVDKTVLHEMITKKSKNIDCLRDVTFLPRAAGKAEPSVGKFNAQRDTMDQISGQ